MHPKKSKIVFNAKEKKIIKLICDENSSQEIGKILDRSNKTIENQVGFLLKKTRSKNRIGIVKYAIRNGLYKLK